MTLGEKQRKFTIMITYLIQWAYNHGYEITFGDAFRDPRAFGKHGEQGAYGRARSNHKIRLAIDLNLFKDGKYLTSTEDHRPLGEEWERMGEEYGVPARWGGRFDDGNHYSIEHWGGR